MEKNFESLYFVIESRLYDIESINDSDIVLYGLIQALSNNRLNSCWASNKWLAERLRKEERSIQRSLARLKDAGLIVTELTNNNKRLIKTQYNKFYEDLRPKKNVELFDYDWLNEKED